MHKTVTYTLVYTYPYIYIFIYAWLSDTPMATGPTLRYPQPLSHWSPRAHTAVRGHGVSLPSCSHAIPRCLRLVASLSTRGVLSPFPLSTRRQPTKKELSPSKGSSVCCGLPWIHCIQQLALHLQPLSICLQQFGTTRPRARYKSLPFKGNI